MLTYKLNEMVVAPGYGLGRIAKIEDKTVLGKSQKYYRIEISTGMTRFCTERSSYRMIRPVTPKRWAVRALKIACADAPEAVSQDYQVRYESLVQLSQSGQILDLARVYSQLNALWISSDLRSNERKLLRTVSKLLFDELRFVLKEAV